MVYSFGFGAGGTCAASRSKFDMASHRTYFPLLYRHRGRVWARSPVHQVVTTGIERTSFVFFYYPSFDANLPVTAPRDDASSSAGATSTNAAAAAVTATAAATEEQVAREPRETIGPYNTLLDLRNKQRGGDAAAVAAAVDEDDASFGQYLARKWGAVFREKK